MACLFSGFLLWRCHINNIVVILIGIAATNNLFGVDLTTIVRRQEPWHE